MAWRDRIAYFEYDNAFLATKLELSPFKMRLVPGLIEGPERVFDRLHGLVSMIAIAQIFRFRYRIM